MRTVAQETAPQIALRDCSKKAAGEDLYKITRFYTIYKILVKGEFNAPSAYFTRRKEGYNVIMKGFIASLDIRDSNIGIMKYLKNI